MKLLIVTQRVDKYDDTLGFFHEWIKKISTKFESVIVICLYKGVVELPANVEVLSLGKEKGTTSRLRFILKFYHYVWFKRVDYEKVFVHMNQEYALLGSMLWKLLGKKVLLWRNHPEGNFLTDVAVWLSDKVFCTSPLSYTAKFNKTIVMPVGIDTDVFKRTIPQKERSGDILCLGRISPIKKPEILLSALIYLKETKVVFVGNFVSNQYEQKVRNMLLSKQLEDKVTFSPATSHGEIPELLNHYQVYVNMTPSGSMDKVIFEAMACEIITIVSNKALENIVPKELFFEENNPESLAQALKSVENLSIKEREDMGINLRRYVCENHSFSKLLEELVGHAN